jgi:hypothetical protein
MKRTLSSVYIKSVSAKKESHNDTALMVIVIIVLILGLFGAIAYPSTLNSLDSGYSSCNVSSTLAMTVVPEPATLVMLVFSGTTMMMLGHKRFK